MRAQRTSWALVLAAIVILSGGGSANADFIFGEPALLDEPVNYVGPGYFDCISADGLELYVDRPIDGSITSGKWDIYVSARERTGDPWSVPVRLGPPVNSDHADSAACLSGDGLELYFQSYRPDGYGGCDIWVATRVSTTDGWEEAVNLGPPINTSDIDALPWITADGLELYFHSNRPDGCGGRDIWVATRSSTSDTWGEPENLGAVVNSPADDTCPCLSPDGLLLVFSDWESISGPWRPGGLGRSDMWITRRKSTADPWEPPVNLGPGMNTSEYEVTPRISPDGSVLFFTSTRPGSGLGASIRDIWQAPILPIVDFNGDGKANGKDVVIMAECWGQDEPLCDIGPYAWGDGVVNKEDLFMLAEYLEKVVTDPTLIGHWALDETEGMAAADSAGGSDAMVMGNAAWQPAGGKIGGALAFDGVDDFVLADSPVGLGDGPFSVCAWIKGGAPGQAIVSPQGGVKWLYTNVIDGSLMTDLSESAGAGTPLFSDVVVNDGQWHRVILVWDGTSRILCVDDREVAKEPLSEVSVPAGKLIIGGSGSLEQGSLWSGLIDDVRIYSRAVEP